MRFEVVDPTHGRVVRVVRISSLESARELIPDLRAAAISWRQVAPDATPDVLGCLGDLLGERADELAWLGARDLGVPLCTGVADVALLARWCTGPIEAAAAGQPGSVWVVPVNVVQPWETVRTAARALASGCGVLVLVRGNGAGVADEVVSLLRQAGAPRELVGCLVVDGEGLRLVQQSEGLVPGPSSEVPESIERVDPSGPGTSDRLVERLVRCAGQDARAPTRLEVTAAQAPTFLEALEVALRQVQPADPRDPETRLGPLLRRDVRDQVHERVQRSVRLGARIRCGGRLPDGPGAFYPPTLLVDVQPGQPVWDEPAGGPVIAVRVVPG